MLENPSFIQTYEQASEDEQKMIGTFVREGNTEKARLWLIKHEENDGSIRALRDEAQVLGIPKYSRMSKQELQNVIKRFKERNISTVRLDSSTPIGLGSVDVCCGLQAGSYRGSYPSRMSEGSRMAQGSDSSPGR